MKESVAIAKEANSKKESSPTRGDNSIQRLRNEPERQLGSLRSVIGNIRRNGGTPSVESIATELSVMPYSYRAPVLLALQQTHGNQYVQRVVTGIQAKLKIGQPGDIYEQEADRVAEQVMQMPEPQVQRQVEPEEEEEIQTKELHGETSEITQNLETDINTIKSSGQFLPKSSRAFFEPRFGQDFSQVRVHTDTKAAESARAVNAKAFTMGRNIVFGAGQYAPGTSAGKRLLAHELTHVIQQGASRPLWESASSNLGRRNSHALMDFEADDEFTEQTPRHVQREEAVRTNPCGPHATPYTVLEGDTAIGIARAHETTLSCLQQMNRGVSLASLHPDQSLNVPTSTCSVRVPTGANVPVLAGSVFAEALQTRTANDEREAIASVFVNRVNHVRSLCGGTICQSPGNGRVAQCTIDTRDFGATLTDAVIKGSTAHGGTQWDKVMNGNSMRSSADICSRIQPGELAPLLRAIAAARTMVGRVGSRRFIAFNQAANAPPSGRMERAVRTGAHTFYRFVNGRECG